MALVRYVGPFEAVEIPYGFGAVEAPRGETIEVPDDLAVSLLEQKDNWQRVRRSRKRKDTDG